MKYQEMVDRLEGIWITSSDTEISFDELLKTISKLDCEIYVGADSNPSRLPYILAVSIAIIKKNEFAKYFYVRWKPWGNEKPSIRDRLVSEVVTSCHVASRMKDVMPNRRINVHADVNPSLKTMSGKYSSELKSMIESYGFAAKIKPDSWAASWLADKLAG